MRNLITAQEVIDLAFAENSNMMAESISDTAIRIAEIKYIRPAFGVMYPLLADKYADFTNDYVKPALAYFVKCEIVSSIAIDMSNSGVAVANPQYQSAATDKQRQRLYDSEMSKAKTLLDFALEYIATHSEEFPDFSGEAPKKHHRVGGILLGGGTSRSQSASIAGEAFKNEIERLSKDVAGKVDKVEGKGLSTNDYTDDDKAEVAKITDKADRREVEELSRKIGNISVDLLAPLTYAELKALKNEGKLVAGMMYRITDYVTTTSQTNTRSANHRFDVIVTALDNRTLSEDAMAIQHDGDEYFANSNLAAWKLRYRFDNDSAEFGWARREDAVELAKWSSQWGVLDTADIDGSKSYIEKEIDGVTKYLYAPSDRGSFLQNFNFYKREVVGSIDDYNELIFESDNAPSIEGEDWDGDGEYDDSYTYWYNVSEIVVKTASGDIVAVLRNADNGDFYDERDDEYYMAGNYAYFNASPEYVDGKYRYTPENIDGWWYGFMGGSVKNYTDVPYSGDYSDLYYCFDTPLPMSEEQQPIPQVCSDSGVLYLSDDWSDTITYSPFVSGGKGVIYRLIDEWNNDLPYDFKNIQHLYDGVWYYTFNDKGHTLDLSLLDKVIYNNKFTRFTINKTDYSYELPLILNILAPRNNAFCNNIIDVMVLTLWYNEAQSIKNVTWRGGDAQRFIDSDYVNIVKIRKNVVLVGVQINGGIGTFNIDTEVNAYNCAINLPLNYDVPPETPSSLTLTQTTGVWYGVDIDMRSTTYEDKHLNIIAGFLKTCKFKGYGTFTTDAYFRDSEFIFTNNIELLKPANGGTMSATKLSSCVKLESTNWSSAETINLDEKIANGGKYNNPFEWCITKNTSGVIKQWCPADLV